MAPPINTNARVRGERRMKSKWVRIAEGFIVVGLVIAMAYSWTAFIAWLRAPV